MVSCYLAGIFGLLGLLKLSAYALRILMNFVKSCEGSSVGGFFGWLARRYQQAALMERNGVGSRLGLGPRDSC